MSTLFPLDSARLRFAGATDIGRKREHNEDSIYLPEENERLAIVCDGMGGHASGDVASRLAVEILVDHFTETAKQQTLTWPYKVDRDVRTHTNRMITSVMTANLEIWERSQREARFKGMGTTCVVMYFLDDIMIVGHVGDSRCYRLRNGESMTISK
jgi:PPM family protein phosphatase